MPPKTQSPARPKTQSPAPEREPDLAADERRELERLRAEKTVRERQAGGPVEEDLSGLDAKARREKYADWPQRGGMDLPQPWDLQRQGLSQEAHELTQSRQGEENDVAPVVVSHNRPTLTSGSADPFVHDLGRRLDKLGFPNSVTRGENPYGVVDQSILQAVAGFRQAYGVEEDPSPFGGSTPAGLSLAAAHIGPWTTEAILRASDREQA